MSHSTPPPSEPIRLGRYEIIEPLGAGSYAMVFAARDTALERYVAIKVFHARYAEFEIRHEALALAHVHHPNVIKLHEIGDDDGLVFLVMELVHGGTLRDYIRERHDWRDVVSVFIQAAHGLAAIHDAGFVHCDVKPDNILIGRNGRVQVADLDRGA